MQSACKRYLSALVASVAETVAVLLLLIHCLWLLPLFVGVLCLVLVVLCST